MRLIFTVVSLSIILSHAILIQPIWARPVSSSNDLKETSLKKEQLSENLTTLNQLMHDTLREAVEHSRKELGPLIMFEEGKIKLFRGDTEVLALPANPPLVYHQLKIIGHTVLVTVIQLWRSDFKGEVRNAWLKHFQDQLTELQKELPSFQLPQDLEASQSKQIKLTQDLIMRALKNEVISHEDLKHYSLTVRPHLKAAFHFSARAHIDLLHQRIGEMYAQLTVEERSQVRGYLYGGRGARVDNLGLQYVSWLIGERTGRESGRMVFSEGIYDKEKALMALAKYGVERELAQIIFDDPEALHRDVLGEATRAYLKDFPDAAKLLGKTP